MEAIKIELKLTDELLKELSVFIKESVRVAVEENLAAKQEEINLTRKEAASRLRISLNTLDRYIESGAITASKAGNRRILIPEKAIESFIKESA